MKRHTLFAAMCAVAVLSSDPGLAATVSGNWDIVNNTGQDANDLHMRIRGARKDAFQESVDGPFGQADVENAPDIPGIGEANAVEVEWDGATVEDGLDDDGNPILDNEGNPVGPDEIHVGLEFDKDVNSLMVVDAYWTKDGQEIGKIDSAKLGFKAGGLFANTLMTLENFSDHELTVRDLQWLVIPDVLPLDQMLPYQFGGWSSSVPDFSLTPGASIDFFPGPLDAGEFLLAQMDVFQTSEPSDRTQVMFQHEAVPLPAAAWFAATGFAMLAGLGRRRMRGSLVV